jgi:uncharacterized membrane protein
MESRAKLLGHPLHQMLIVFPFGLLGMAPLLDLAQIIDPGKILYPQAFVMIGLGVITGLVAAVFGAIDWWAVPEGTRAKRIGMVHGLGNVVVVLLFASSWYLRWTAQQQPSSLAYALSFSGFALVLLTGWLGGELVDRLGVGVDSGANLNAPSSLTHKRVTQ